MPRLYDVRPRTFALKRTNPTFQSGHFLKGLVTPPQPPYLALLQAIQQT